MGNISKNVERLRKKLNYSQEKLAYLGKTSQKTISLIENGKVGNIKYGTLKGIADALGCHVSDLIQDEKPIPTEIKTVIDILEDAIKKLKQLG